MTISLNDIRLYAYHGVLEEERQQGNWFHVTASFEVDCPEAILSDELTDTVNYAEVAYIIQQEMLIPSRLIEHVAGRIAQRVMDTFTLIRQITVTVHKEHPPIPMECASSSVTLSINRVNQRVRP